MNLMPFGSSSDTVIFTLPGYVSSTWYLPCTFQILFVGNSPRPSMRDGPLSSMSIPQCAVSKWCAPQPVIMPSE
jgi:hypothetical protein